MSRHRKLIAVKRHMRRFVPPEKYASLAARVVTTPAVSPAFSTEPGRVDCRRATNLFGSERSTSCCSSCW
jgi:hypothetical protein